VTNNKYGFFAEGEVDPLPTLWFTNYVCDSVAYATFELLTSSRYDTETYFLLMKVKNKPKK
jgi:hypothetical protein